MQLPDFRLWRGPVFKGTLLLTAPLACHLAGPPVQADAAVAAVLRLASFGALMLLYLSFAYAANDWADREADRAAGKARTLGRLPAGLGLAVTLALGAATLLAGWRFHATPLFLGLLLAGLLLGWAYSVRPLRLKARGAAGALLAPVVGKVIPILLAGVAWDCPGAWWLLLLAAAEWTKNVIDILFHQVIDAAADRLAGVGSWPVVHGDAAAHTALRRFCRAGVVAAVLQGGALAVVIPEFRWVLGAALLLAPPAAFLLRRRVDAAPANRMTGLLPPLYQWLGGVLFVQMPLWLALVAAWRTPVYLWLAVPVAVIIAAQTLFFLRYRYR